MARCPRCFSNLEDEEWTDDPIKTPKGEAGEDYIGFTYFNPVHIEELQEARTQQEINVGIPEAERTTFTPVKIEGERVYFYKKHIRELRESTEKILNATGQTKDSYFNYDETGKEYNIGNHQTDWHDVDLSKKIYIKAVHIEDLRHHILTAVPLWMSLRNRDKSMGGIDNLLSDIYWYYSGYIDVVYFSTFMRSDFIQKIHPCSEETIDYNISDLSYNEETGEYRWKWDSNIYRYNKSLGKVFYQAYYTHNLFSNWQATVLATPRTGTSSLTQLELKEYIVAPQLILETPRYPCERQLFAGSPKEARPKFKGCGFLEDAVFAKENINTDVYEHEGKTTYIGENIPCTEQQGINEDVFHERNMQTNTEPPTCLWQAFGEVDYFRSVSIVGSQMTGNFSIFVPDFWAFDQLQNRKENKIISYPITYDDWKYSLSIRDEVIQTNVEDPRTEVIYDLHFRNNCLLTKEDGVEWVARNNSDFDENITPLTESIPLPADTIEASVILIIDGETWEKTTTDFSAYTANDKVYQVKNNQILFGDGIHGYRIPGNTTASIECYSDEIPVTKYYADGIIVLPLVEADEETSIYIKINYYNVPHTYNEFSNPIRYYDNIAQMTRSEVIIPATTIYGDPMLDPPPSEISQSGYDNLLPIVVGFDYTYVGLKSFRTLKYTPYQ